MTDATRLALAQSTALGAAWTVLNALAKETDRCIAHSSLETLIRATRYSQRNVIRALGELEELKEIEKLQSVTDGRRHLYHLRKICDIKNASKLALGPFVCPQWAAFSTSSKIGDWPKRSEKWVTPILLPEMIIEIEQAKSEEREPWAAVVLDTDLEFYSNELRRKVGLPLAKPNQPGLDLPSQPPPAKSDLELRAEIAEQKRLLREKGYQTEVPGRVIQFDPRRRWSDFSGRKGGGEETKSSGTVSRSGRSA